MGGLLENKKKQRVKRGGRKYKKNNKSLSIFSTNAAGLKFKVQSLKNELKNCQAAVFSIQESHFAKKENSKLKIMRYLGQFGKNKRGEQ